MLAVLRSVRSLALDAAAVLLVCLVSESCFDPFRLWAHKVSLSW